MNSVWLSQSCARSWSPSLRRGWKSSTIWSLESTVRCQTRAFSQLPNVQHEPHPHVAIIGSGPAGFYTARKLMRDIPGTKIDMYERLPVPFGLVRFGVAPDHPEVKNCQDEFEQVASSPDFTFVGNVQLGFDLPLPILAKHYDAIIFAYGASKDRKLGIQGEDKPHIYSARALVGWYNGLPEYRDLEPDLSSGETAVVVGQGNVALDVARILLSNVDDLKKTDLTDYAIQALSKSTIRHVRVIGRRGPMQASFTIKEVRELIQLQGVNFEPIASHLFPSDLKKLERPKRRIMELLQKGKPHDASAVRSCSFDFLLAPNSFAWATDDSNELTGVVFNETKLADITDPSSKVTVTNREVVISTSTLFRSIGYKAEALPGMDLIGANFDERSGTLRHDGFGRIMPYETLESQSIPSTTATSPTELSTVAKKHRASLYCAGWVKRGPTGVIASTMTDAFQTAEAVAADWKEVRKAGENNMKNPLLGWNAVQADAKAEGYNLQHVVDWDGWHRIDQIEREAGKRAGKPREKLGSIRQLEAAASA